jgi:hypothetical protein
VVCREPHTFGGEPVQVGSAGHAVAVTPEYVARVVVGKYEQEIWFTSGLRARSRRNQGGYHSAHQGAPADRCRGGDFGSPKCGRQASIIAHGESLLSACDTESRNGCLNCYLHWCEFIAAMSTKLAAVTHITNAAFSAKTTDRSKLSLYGL